MVLFGGYDGKNRFNDVNVYDPELGAWTAIEAVGEIPSKRFGHSSVCNEDSMYVFGGWDGAQTLSGLHRYFIFVLVVFAYFYKFKIK